MFISFIVLISIFHFIKSSNDYKCKKTDINREIEIGDEVTLCLHSIKNKIKIAYKLKVDDYSIFTIQGGYNTFVKTGNQEGTRILDQKEKYNFRNMISEPNNNNKINLLENNTNNNGTEFPLTNINTTIDFTNQVTDNPSDSSDSSDSNGDEIDSSFRSLFIAEIGDKITQYPSVIIILIYN